MDLEDPILDSVDLKVGDTDLVGELLSSPAAQLANRLDSQGNEGWFLGHARDISGLDIGRLVVSKRDTEPRDIVSAVKKAPSGFSYAECEKWMSEHGLDWDRIRKLANFGTNDATLKNRWGNFDLGRDGKQTSPRDRAKIFETLLKIEEKTPEGERGERGRKFVALAEWERMASDLLEDLPSFERAISAAREYADVARLNAASRRLKKEADDKARALEAREAASASFASATPAQDSRRKPRK